VAAHLAGGASLDDVGTPIIEPLRLALPIPQPIPGGWRGEVIHIDHFGNVASNLRVELLKDWLASPGRVTVRLGGVEIRGLVSTFGERPHGELVTLFGSTGNLIVSVVNGDAAGRLGVKVGDPFEASIE
jgi:S-adenosylmethionine hydrolase